MSISSRYFFLGKCSCLIQVIQGLTVQFFNFLFIPNHFLYIFRSISFGLFKRVFEVISYPVNYNGFFEIAQLHNTLHGNLSFYANFHHGTFCGENVAVYCMSEWLTVWFFIFLVFSNHLFHISFGPCHLVCFNEFLGSNFIKTFYGQKTFQLQ